MYYTRVELNTAQSQLPDLEVTNNWMDYAYNFLEFQETINSKYDLDGRMLHSKLLTILLHRLYSVS